MGSSIRRLLNSRETDLAKLNKSGLAEAGFK